MPNSNTNLCKTQHFHSNHSKNPKASPMIITSSGETFGLLASGTPVVAKGELFCGCGRVYVGGAVKLKAKKTTV